MGATNGGNETRRNFFLNEIRVFDLANLGGAVVTGAGMISRTGCHMIGGRGELVAGRWGASRYWWHRESSQLLWGGEGRVVEFETIRSRMRWLILGAGVWWRRFRRG